MIRSRLLDIAYATLRLLASVYAFESRRPPSAPPPLLARHRLQKNRVTVGWVFLPVLELSIPHSLSLGSRPLTN